MLVKQCCIPSEQRHLGFRLAWLFRGLRAVRQTPACYGQRTPRGSGNTSSTQWHPGRVRSSPPGKKFSDKASKIEPSSLILHFRSLRISLCHPLLHPLMLTDSCYSDCGPVVWASLAVVGKSHLRACPGLLSQNLQF